MAYDNFGAGPSRRRTQHSASPGGSVLEAENFRLAAQISLDEAERLQRHLRRTSRVSTDADVALAVFAADIRSSIMIDDDRAIAEAMQAFQGGEDVGQT